MESSNELPNHFKEQVHFVCQAMNEPNKYSNRYVAFLDVLGFKAIIQENTAEWIKTNIYDDVRRINTLFRTDLYKSLFPEASYKQLEFVLISDSFIISIPTEAERSLDVIIGCCFVLQQFFVKREKPILLRGGISKGDFYHFEQTTFGPGLVKAYNIENEISVYPRIIIDKDLPVSSICVGKDNIARAFCSIDEDGQQYIDYIKSVAGFSIGNHEELRRLHDFIDSNIKRFSTDERTLEKYRWLAKQLNSSLKLFFEDNSPNIVNLYSVDIA